MATWALWRMLERLRLKKLDEYEDVRGEVDELRGRGSVGRLRSGASEAGAIERTEGRGVAEGGGSPPVLMRSARRAPSATRASPP